MLAKAFEIRDIATFIPVLAVDMNPSIFYGPVDSDRFHAQRYLLRRCGYACNGQPNILLTRLSGELQATNDPYIWDDRTFSVAHIHIIENWKTLHDGDVIDVEFILGETKQRKISERHSVP